MALSRTWCGDVITSRRICHRPLQEGSSVSSSSCSRRGSLFPLLSRFLHFMSTVQETRVLIRQVQKGCGVLRPQGLRPVQWGAEAAGRARSRAFRSERRSSGSGECDQSIHADSGAASRDCGCHGPTAPVLCGKIMGFKSRFGLNLDPVISWLRDHKQVPFPLHLLLARKWRSEPATSS